MAKVDRTLLLLALFLVLPTLSDAEENSPAESARELMAPLPVERLHKTWEVSLDGSWLPDSDSSDGGGSIGISEYRIKTGRTFRANTSLSFTPEITYSLLHISAPTGARLPENLHSISFGLRSDYRVSEPLTFSFLLAPGLAGDFRDLGRDDIRVRIGATARYSPSEKLTLLGGLIYQQGYRSLPAFPFIGFIYRPDRRWTVTVGAPRTGVSYAAGKDLRLNLGAEMSRREYQLHEERVGAEVIRYGDYRVEGGAEASLLPPLKVEVAGGYAFGRKFVFYDRFDATRKNIEVDSGPFIRAGVKAQW